VAVLTFISVRTFYSLAAAPKQPFTVLLHEERYGPNSQTPGYTEHFLEAFRSDGSKVWLVWRRFPDGQWYSQKSVSDAANGAQVTIDEATKSRSTTYLSASDVASLKSAPSVCADEPKPKHATVLGFDVVLQSRKIRTSGGDVYRTEEWRAPALNCYPLRATFTRTRPNGLVDRTAREAISVIPGEPADSLFGLDAGYPELSPSQMSAEYERRFGRPIVSPGRARQLDDNYYSQRPR
jgi:hypothetical protein